MDNKWWWLWIVVFNIFATQMANALSVHCEKWPEQEQNSNAEAQSYHNAINGGCPLTAEESREIESFTPEKQHSRYYVRGGLNFSHVNLQNIKNGSAALTLSSLQVAKKQVAAKHAILELAVGYLWPAYRGEVEYVHANSMEYISSPVLLGSTEKLVSRVTGKSLLFNGYYDFLADTNFRPYIGAGLGMAYQFSKSILTGGIGTGEEKHRRRIGAAYGFSTGIKMHMFSTFQADIGFRYACLGPIEWKVFETFKLKGKKVIWGPRVSLLYLL